MGASVDRRGRLISVPRPALIALATARARLRASEFGMAALAVGVGVLAGLCVAAMTKIVNVAHVAIFGIPFDIHLSAAERVAPLAAFGAPDAGRAGARRDRHVARSQESAPRGRPGRSQRLARRTHVAEPEPPRGDANRDLERLPARRSGSRRAMLRSGRGSPRIWESVAPAPAGLADARRLRGRRGDRGGVRRAADRRLLRLRAHHRRLFARQRDPGLRRDPRRRAHHRGGHRRALRHRRARRRSADLPALWRADRARPRRGGGRRRGDARGGADRTGVPRGDPLAPHSAPCRRTDGRRDGALHAPGAGGGPWRARARLLLADDAREN